MSRIWHRLFGHPGDGIVDHTGPMLFCTCGVVLDRSYTSGGGGVW